MCKFADVIVGSSLILTDQDVLCDNCAETFVEPTVTIIYAGHKMFYGNRKDFARLTEIVKCPYCNYPIDALYWPCDDTLANELFRIVNNSEKI